MNLDTDRLRDLLERTAPHRPVVAPGARAAAVARRGRAARIRDRGLVAGAAAAVLAAAIAVPLSLGGDDDPGNVAVAPPAPTAPPCPAERLDVGTPAPVPALGDVVSVRSCAATWQGNAPDASTALPTTPLVGDAAAAFAEDVASLPTYAMPAQCAAISLMPDPWALVVTTADGGSVVLGSTMRACGAVSVGGAERGAEEVVAAFGGNLARQEAGDPAPGADGPSCPDGDRLANGADTWNGSFDIASATAGAVCYRVDPMGGREYSDVAGELTADQLTTVRDDLAAHVGAAPAELYGCTDTGPQRLLVLVDADGDRAALVDDRCSGGFSGAHGYWQPGPAAEAAIADALGGRVG